MSKKVFGVSMTILMIAIGVLVFLNVRKDKENEPKYDAIIPMANQNVIWTGAGYNGIYGEAAD